MVQTITIQPLAFISLRGDLKILFCGSIDGPVSNPTSCTDQTALSEGRVILTSAYEYLLPREVSIQRELTRLNNLQTLSEKEEENRLIFISMLDILDLYRAQLELRNTFLHSDDFEKDNSLVDALFPEIEQEQTISDITVNVVVEETVAEIVAEVEVVSNTKTDDNIFSCNLYNNQIAMDELFCVVLEKISPNTSHSVKGKHRNNLINWGHVKQAMINVKIITANTTMASFGRAMHNMDVTRSAKSIEASCKRYNLKCLKKNLTNSDENSIKDIEYLLLSVLKLMAA